MGVAGSIPKASLRLGDIGFRPSSIIPKTSSSGSSQ